MQYFSISGRAALTGLKGYRLSPLQHDTSDKVMATTTSMCLTVFTVGGVVEVAVPNLQ